MRTKVIRARPPQPSKNAAVLPWLVGVGATSVILLGAAWPLITSPSHPATPALSRVAPPAGTKPTAPAMTGSVSAQKEDRADPIEEIKEMARLAGAVAAAPAQHAVPEAESQSTDKAAASAPVPTVAEGPGDTLPAPKPAAAPAATPANPTAPPSRNMPAQAAVKPAAPQSGQLAATPRTKPPAAEPRQAAKQEVTLRKDAAASMPLLTLTSLPMARNGSMPLPPPPTAREEPVALKPKQSLYEQVRSKLPAEITEDQATKPAVPDNVSLQSPKVVAVSGDLVYVRINPQQTVTVKVGGAIPGLGVLRKVEASGAQFEKQFVPNM